MELSFSEFSVLVGVFLLAGAVKGVIGMGLPTVSVGLMSIWLAAPEAAAILVMPAILTNVWQMFSGPYLLRVLRRLWPLMVTLVIFTILGTAVITGAGGGLLSILLGIILILFAVMSLAGWNFSVSRRAERILGPATGITTGLITGATAVFVIPSVPYIQALKLEKIEFTQAIGVGALLATAGLGTGLGVHGQFPILQIALPGSIATVAAFAGMAAGRIVQERMEVEVFRRWVLFGLIALGAAMIVRVLG